MIKVGGMIHDGYRLPKSHFRDVTEEKVGPRYNATAHHGPVPVDEDQFARIHGPQKFSPDSFFAQYRLQCRIEVLPSLRDVLARREGCERRQPPPGSLGDDRRWLP